MSGDRYQAFRDSMFGNSTMTTRSGRYTARSFSKTVLLPALVRYRPPCFAIIGATARKPLKRRK
jgi:hypothetical protein